MSCAFDVRFCCQHLQKAREEDLQRKSLPERKGSSPNHHFFSELLVLGSVLPPKMVGCSHAAMIANETLLKWYEMLGKLLWVDKITIHLSNPNSRCGYTPQKTAHVPSKGPFQKERLVFAPPFFRRHVSFRVSTSIFTLAVQVDHKNSRELHQRLCLWGREF